MLTKQEFEDTLFSEHEPTYDRQKKKYHVALNSVNLRTVVFGHGETKELALQDGKMRAYAQYAEKIGREAAYARLEPRRKVFENLAKECFKDTGYSFDKLEVNLITGKFEIFLEDDLNFDYTRKIWRAAFDLLDSELQQSLIDQANDLKATHKRNWNLQRLDKLAKAYRACIDKLPVMQPKYAKPGQVIFSKRGNFYCEIISISPTGLKIMVNSFNRTSGPESVIEKLDKDQRAAYYYVMSREEFDRFYAIGKRITALKNKVIDRANDK